MASGTSRQLQAVLTQLDLLESLASRFQTEQSREVVAAEVEVVGVAFEVKTVVAVAGDVDKFVAAVAVVVTAQKM